MKKVLFFIASFATVSAEGEHVLLYNNTPHEVTYTTRKGTTLHTTTLGKPGSDYPSPTDHTIIDLQAGSITAEGSKRVSVLRNEGDQLVLIFHD